MTTMNMFIIVVLLGTTMAFTIPQMQRHVVVVYSSDNNDNESSSEDKVTSFDQAGRSLMEQETDKRIREMGDFDSNPAYKQDSIDQMREAIRQRTEKLGLEKSKLSRELIEQAQLKAKAGQQSSLYNQESNINLDLTQITDFQRQPQDDPDLPSIMFDPDDQLSEDEKKEADPVGRLPIYSQAIAELTSADWPTPFAALREVGVMLIVIAVTGVLVVNWDNFLRGFYTDVLQFLPKPEDIAQQYSIDSTALPQGWTDNMSDQDMQQLFEQSSNVVAPPLTTPPPLTPPTTTTLPEL